MTHVWTRTSLVVLQSFVALTAIAGAIWVVPTLPPDWFGSHVFATPTIPAFALGVLVGGSAAIAAIAAIVRPQVAGPLAILAGLTIIGFELVEILVVGLAVVEYGAQHPQSWLQIVYLVLGAIGVALGYALWRMTEVDRTRWVAHG